jgi:hypothetical protein
MDRMSILKMPILLKSIYRFSEILIKIPMSFFTKIEKSIKWSMKDANSQSNPEQKWVMLEVSNQIILQSHSKKNNVVLVQNIQQNRTEDWKINTHTFVAIWFLTKEPKTYVEEKTVFSTSGIGKTGYPHIEDWNLSPDYSPCAKTNSKYFRDQRH